MKVGPGLNKIFTVPDDPDQVVAERVDAVESPNNQVLMEKWLKGEISNETATVVILYMLLDLQASVIRSQLTSGAPGRISRPT